MNRFALLTTSMLALLVYGAAQDEEGGGEICPKFNACKKSESKEKTECPDCGKSKIPADYAFCASCARKANVCSRCGLPKTATGGKKAKNIDEAADMLEEKRLREVLTYLASDELEGRCAGYPGNDKATQYHADIYKKAGLKPGNGDSFFQEVAGRFVKPARNTLAILEGTDLKDQYIVIGGHNDHVGKSGAGAPGQQMGGPQGGDNIWNGADDNGSGSTTVTVLSEVLARSGLKPRRSILFMTFCGEEWGMVGSRHFCANPTVAKDKIVAMINVDMIGRMNAAMELNVYGLGTEDGNEWEALMDKHGAKLSIKVGKIQGTKIGGGDSDHSSFRDIGIPCMFFFEGGPMQPDYHRVTDSVEKINFPGMTKVGKMIMQVLWELANTDKRWTFKKT
jgi:hypothetical protein